MSSFSFIQPHATHYSEQLKTLPHEEEVIVAGCIIEVVKSLAVPILESESSEHPAPEYMYLIKLDDYVGRMAVLVTDELYEHYKGILIPENFIKAKGFVNSIVKPNGHEAFVMAYDCEILNS